MTGSSGACHTCKTRRVKCDETKPVCQRCAKSRRVCIATAAPKQPSFSIHVENDYASGQSKRPRGPRSNLTAPQPPVDLETKAVAYYFQFHLQTPPDTPPFVGGLWECIEMWKASGRQDYMVDLAISSMALAVYSRTQNDPQAGSEASLRYHDLLKIVHNRIEKMEFPTLSERDIDACLLTVFLMGRLEGVMHELSASEPAISLEHMRSLMHHKGALAILKVWNDNLSSTTASEIVKQTRRGQIRSAILTSRALPEWIHDGKRFGEQGLEIEYDFILIQIVALRDSLASLQKMEVVETALVKALISEIQSIDKMLQNLTARLVLQYPHFEHSLPTSEHAPSDSFYSRKLLTFATPGHAGPRTHVIGTRMLLTSTQISILDLEAPGLLDDPVYSAIREDSKRQLTSLGGDLAACIPFCLERIKLVDSDAPRSLKSFTINRDGAMHPFSVGLFIWVLTLASCLKHMDAGQQRWFRSALASAGKAIGDSNMSGADSDQWALVI